MKPASRPRERSSLRLHAAAEAAAEAEIEAEDERFRKAGGLSQEDLVRAVSVIRLIVYRMQSVSARRWRATSSAVMILAALVIVSAESYIYSYGECHQYSKGLYKVYLWYNNSINFKRQYHGPQNPKWVFHARKQNVRGTGLQCQYNSGRG